MAAVTINTDEKKSRWYRAATAVLAQQAAADELLRIIETGMPEPSSSHDPMSTGSGAGDPGGTVIDRRGELNMLRQQGILRDFGWEVVKKEGPDHRPVFTMAGWALTKEGERFETPPVAAESKKEGALRCGNEIWENLKGRGIVG
jgi:dsRNA-specific ribonuclease